MPADPHPGRARLARKRIKRYCLLTLRWTIAVVGIPAALWYGASQWAVEALDWELEMEP